MEIEFIVQERENGKMYDLSEVVGNISWDTQISGQPGKLSFTYPQDEQVSLPEGSIVRLKVGGKGVFYGYIFSRKSQNDDEISVVAYDQMRYLKNKNLYKFANMTASQVFEKVCKDAKLKYKVVNSSSFVLPTRLHDDRTLFDIIQHGIDFTLAYSREWYMIRDNFGVLEFVDLKQLKVDIIIGDESLLNEYDYASSIDTDTYNQVKLSKENKGSNKRDVYIVKDSSTIGKWGLLQYDEKMDENANAAQIADKAEKLLKLKNRPTKTLTLKCLGDLRVFAGCQVILDISSLWKEGLERKYFIVNKCEHSFKNNMHTMDLEMVVNYE